MSKTKPGDFANDNSVVSKPLPAPLGVVDYLSLIKFHRSHVGECSKDAGFGSPKGPNCFFSGKTKKKRREVENGLDQIEPKMSTTATIEAAAIKRCSFLRESAGSNHR